MFWINVRILGIGKIKTFKNIHYSPDYLNLHFHSYFKRDSTDLDQNCSNTLVSDVESNISFSFFGITECDLLQAFSRVKSEAIGLDLVDLRFIKIIYPLVSNYILYIFNYIITSSSFPLQWKKSKIVPISKVINKQIPPILDLLASYQHSPKFLKMF